MKPTITEAEYEALLDARVMRVLYSDSRYVNAENAEEQAKAEATIEREADEALRDKYEIR